MLRTNKAGKKKTQPKNEDENVRGKPCLEGLRAIRLQFSKLYLHYYRQMLNRDGKIANDGVIHNREKQAVNISVWFLEMSWQLYLSRVRLLKCFVVH